MMVMRRKEGILRLRRSFVILNIKNFKFFILIIISVFQATDWGGAKGLWGWGGEEEKAFAGERGGREEKTRIRRGWCYILQLAVSYLFFSFSFCRCLFLSGFPGGQDQGWEGGAAESSLCSSQVLSIIIFLVVIIAIIILSVAEPLRRKGRLEVSDHLLQFGRLLRWIWRSTTNMMMMINNMARPISSTLLMQNITDCRLCQNLSMPPRPEKDRCQGTSWWPSCNSLSSCQRLPRFQVHYL